MTCVRRGLLPCHCLPWKPCMEAICMFPLVMHWFPFDKWYIKTLTHVPQHITLFVNRVDADKISQSEAILEEGRTLIQYAWCSFEKTVMWRHTDTEREPCEDRGQHWSDTSTLQGMPGIGDHDQKPGERCGRDSSSKPSEGTNLDDNLPSHFKHPELWENKFVWFSATSFVLLGHSIPGKFNISPPVDAMTLDWLCVVLLQPTFLIFLVGFLSCSRPFTAGVSPGSASRHLYSSH